MKHIWTWHRIFVVAWPIHHGHIKRLNPTSIQHRNGRHQTMKTITMIYTRWKTKCQNQPTCLWRTTMISYCNIPLRNASLVRHPFSTTWENMSDWWRVGWPVRRDVHRISCWPKLPVTFTNPMDNVWYPVITRQLYNSYIHYPYVKFLVLGGWRRRYYAHLILWRYNNSTRNEPSYDSYLIGIQVRVIFWSVHPLDAAVMIRSLRRMGKTRRV